MRTGNVGRPVVRKLLPLFALAALAAALAGGPLAARAAEGAAFASNVVIPQARVFSGRAAADLPLAATAVRRPPPPVTTERIRLEGVTVGVVVRDLAATTTMDLDLLNLTDARQEAELIVPVPEGAVLRGFDFQGGAAEPTARILPRAEAVKTYRDLVARIRDPALLELAGQSLLRSSVFPVEPRGKQRLRLTYEHLLVADGERVDYFLPRSEALTAAGVPWKIGLRLTASGEIATVYSPSHEIVAERKSPREFAVHLADSAAREPGGFLLSWLRQAEGGSGEPSAALYAYPDAKGESGNFLLLAGLPVDPPPRAARQPREVTLVLDRSGSMRNEKKLEQAVAAAKRLLAGLEEGERFQIIDFANSVSCFAARPVARSAETLQRATAYLDALEANGGTNLHEALIEALRQPPTEGALPLVLCLTDGLPTIGVTDEAKLRAAAEAANRHGRRLFTIGVGYEVNQPLLDRLATASRGRALVVQPGDSLELKLDQLVRSLGEPVFADLELTALDAQGRPDPARTADLHPARPPDLFAGEPLIILGRYRGEGELSFRVRGRYFGRTREFRFSFPLARATVRNGFVPRLWASRRIGELIDAIRQAGAESAAAGYAVSAAARPAGAPTPAAAVAGVDPRVRELVDEIVRLSLEWGILTEYTAFLVREGTDLSRRDEVLAEANANFLRRAVATRDGRAAANQQVNISAQRDQQRLNRRNEFYDQNMQRVETSDVWQVNDRTLVRQGERWVDARLLNRSAAGAGKAAPEIEFGSAEHLKLAERLAGEGRQGLLAAPGRVTLEVDGKATTVRGPSGE